MRIVGLSGSWSIYFNKATSIHRLSSSKWEVGYRATDGNSYYITLICDDVWIEAL